MPYITQDRRKELIALEKLELLSPGDLNFLISRLIWKEFDRSPSYTKANEIVGVLECAKQEFIRRKLNPYEDKKILENGDL